jgi:hypothetical protein
MSNIEALARDWLDAKKAENEAAARRVAIEAQLAAALEVKEEGSITHKLDGYKVTLTQPVTRKLDEAAWEKVKSKAPMEMWPVKTNVEADATGMKWLEKNEPAIWRKIASAFESKKGKVGVKVESV